MKQLTEEEKRTWLVHDIVETVLKNQNSIIKCKTSNLRAYHPDTKRILEEKPVFAIEKINENGRMFEELNPGDIIIVVKTTAKEAL